MLRIQVEVAGVRAELAEVRTDLQRELWNADRQLYFKKSSPLEPARNDHCSILESQVKFMKVAERK